MENIETLAEVAYQMVEPGKGILAIDESNGTCTKRFEALGVESTEEHRRQYRQLLVSAPGIEEFCSGMILFDETLRQKNDAGTPLPQVMKEKGMLVGIKVDTGAKELALSEGEKVTEGLDGLRERLAEYKALGADFAKWRAVITIDEGTPSSACVEANVHALARYAALCQEAGIVPIVEPEVLIEGDHTIGMCYGVTEHVLKSLFQELYKQNVIMEGCVLKASMVIAGKACEEQASIEDVAEGTIECLYNTVPAAMPGVVFLSGGQTEMQSTQHLNTMNQMGEHPWSLTFSYGRAIQQPALHEWAKDIKNNTESAQKKLVHRAKMNALASVGQWTDAQEKAA
jgi:fructose-bisphosphate aldolase class I